MKTRYIFQKDLEAIVNIETQSFDFPWTYSEFINTLKVKNCIGKVCIVNDVVAGYILYEFAELAIYILNLAVDENLRRMGIGSRLLTEVIDKLSIKGRKKIIIEIIESNIIGQIFFRKHGFIATSIEKSPYEDMPDEDSYIMEHSIINNLCNPKNRMKSYINE